MSAGEQLSWRQLLKASTKIALEQRAPMSFAFTPGASTEASESLIGRQIEVKHAGGAGPVT